MKNDKRIFILTEAVLGILVIILAFLMFREKNGQDEQKISVIVQNSEDSQWHAFKYGLAMAAEDHEIELYIVSTGEMLTASQEKALMEDEIDYGADAIIVQPAPGEETEQMLKEMQNKVPIMLVESASLQNGEKSEIPLTAPDYYAMGKALAEEMVKDYGKNLKGKSVLILSQAGESEAAEQGEKGIMEVLGNTGVQISRSVWDSSEISKEDFMKRQPKADLVVALDDTTLTAAGEYSAVNSLHGAVVYGVGKSTEAVYYLDTRAVECLVVPDEFNVGYQSLTETAESLKHSFYEMRDRNVEYTVIRREMLFSKQNQEILFTMSQ